MKRICLLASAFLIFLLSANISFAEDLTPTPFPQSNYELPYPGLLPDNPLYTLKVIRDKIVSFLISDPLKKAEFNLLQADKRLNAGVYLFNKNKNDLAITTISKAENYFGQALQKTKEAKGQGMRTAEIANKLADASKKHQEVLKSLEEKSPKKFKSGFNQELQRVDKFAEDAISLTLK